MHKIITKCRKLPGNIQGIQKLFLFSKLKQFSDKIVSKRAVNSLKDKNTVLRNYEGISWRIQGPQNTQACQTTKDAEAPKAFRASQGGCPSMLVKSDIARMSQAYPGSTIIRGGQAYQGFKDFIMSYTKEL